MYRSVGRLLRLLVCPLALCATIVLLNGSQAAAQCKVEGTVKAADGTPVAGATVQLISTGLKGAPPTTTTGPDGTYHFDNVKAGIWAEIRVTGTGSPIVRAFSLITNWTETIDVQAPREADVAVTIDDLDPMGGDAGAVRGVVRGQDGTPIEDALVSIGDTDVGARTDASGRYSFGRVRSKLSLELHASAAGYEPRQQVVKVPENGSADADFTLAIAHAAAQSETALPADAGADVAEMFVHPGVFPAFPARTPRDVGRTIQFLPAVAASVENSADLSVRGGTPDQTLVTYDNLTWYPSPRLFSGLSPFNDESVAGAALADNMFRANRGGRLAAAALVNGDTMAVGRPTGGVDLNAFGWAANASVPLGPVGSFHFGARRPLTDSLYQDALDWFSPTQFVRDRVPRFSGSTFGTSPVPTYAEYEGGIDIKAGSRDRISVNFYDAKDTGNFSRDFALPSSSSSTTTSFSVPSPINVPSDVVVQGADVQQWTGKGLSGNWTHSGASVSATASLGQSKFTREHGQSFSLTSPTNGLSYDIAAGRGGSSAYLENGSIQDTTANVDATIRAGFQHAISVGGEVNRIDNTYDSSQEAVRTAAGVAIAPAMYPLLSDHTSAQVVSVFAQDTWRPMGRLSIAPGARITHYDVTSSSYFEPRILGSYELLRNVRFNAGWSIDHQFMNGITREDREHGDTWFWALANGTFIPVARSEQVSGGVTMEARGLLFTGQIYYRTLDDVTIFAPRLLTGVVPGPNGSGFYTGTGTSTGADLMVEHRQGPNTIWASAEVGRVKYTYPGLEAATFLGSNDKAVEFKIADNVRIRGGWSASAAWVVTSGLAFTPVQAVQQVWFPTGTTAYQALFLAKNSERLPQYHRLDVSSEYAVHVGAVTTTFGATLFNVYDRNNLQGYDTESVGTAPISNDITMMSRAINAFFRLGF